MGRTPRNPLVGIPLTRALLCPNDDTVYDSDRWRACPTCQNEDRIFLSRLLGGAAHAEDRVEGTTRVASGTPIPVSHGSPRRIWGFST
jgi:hypothetical protein